LSYFVECVIIGILNKEVDLLIIRNFILIFSALVFIRCSPEDGWCSIEKHTGNDDFNCSQMDKDFSCTGQSILESFTTLKFIYNKTEVADNNEFETITQRPEYIPDTLTFKVMGSCSLAPKVGGINCTSWTKFSFLTEENLTVTASSRSGDKTSSTCNPKFIEIQLEEKTLTGIKNSTELYFNDTVTKNGNEIKVRHGFTAQEL